LSFDVYRKTFDVSVLPFDAHRKVYEVTVDTDGLLQAKVALIVATEGEK
jgi:hypothetical protein